MADILKRRFKYKETVLDDIPNLTVHEILKHYSMTFPELTNATIVGPNIVNGVAEYSFKTLFGTKG